MIDMGYVFQQRQIKDTRDVTRDLRDQQRADRDTHARDMQRLEERIEGLALVTQAMAELLQSQGVNSATLADKVREIDLRDGLLDGRITPKAVPCTSCARSVHPRLKACMYCGTAAVR